MRDNPADNNPKSFRINALKKGDEWGVDPTRFSKWRKTKLKRKLKNGSSLLRVRGWVYRVIDNYRHLLQQHTTGERIPDELTRTEEDIVREAPVGRSHWGSPPQEEFCSHLNCNGYWWYPWVKYKTHNDLPNTTKYLIIYQRENLRKKNVVVHEEKLTTFVEVTQSNWYWQMSWKLGKMLSIGLVLRIVPARWKHRVSGSTSKLDILYL